jgi:hypothetical protein
MAKPCSSVSDSHNPRKPPARGVFSGTVVAKPCFSTPDGWFRRRRLRVPNQPFCHPKVSIIGCGNLVTWTVFESGETRFPGFRVLVSTLWIFRDLLEFDKCIFGSKDIGIDTRRLSEWTPSSPRLW